MFGLNIQISANLLYDVYAHAVFANLDIFWQLPYFENMYMSVYL